MRANIVRHFTSLIVCGLLAGAAGHAGAQESGAAQAVLDSRFGVDLGAFIVNSNLKARLNGASQTNPDIDFDDSFGRAKDAIRWRADALWRITPKHQLRFMYFDNASSRTRTLSEDIPWGDYTFHVGASATLDYKQQTSALTYEYAFIREPNYEVAAGLGVHYSKTTIGLSGTASLIHPDGTVDSGSFTTKNSTVLAPLPVIALRAGWVVAPQWLVGAEGQVFKAHYDAYDGQWVDLRASVTWMYNRHFGVGLGLNSFTSNLKLTKENFDGRLKTGYTGAMLYVTSAF
jgi:hypothetical protein